MTASSHRRGHKIVYWDGRWVYKDDGTSVEEERPCLRCGEMPDEDGHDACLGHLDGVSSACCGHGVSRKIRIRENERD